MAKRTRQQTRPQAARSVEASITIGRDTIRVSRGLASAISELHDGLVSFGAVLAQHRADLAEPMWTAYQQFSDETGRTFVDFARAIDSNIPNDRNYRTHPTYMAADYLRRLALRRADARTVNAGAPTKSLRVNAVNRLARLLKTVLQVVAEADLAEVWQGIATEFSMTDRQLETLKGRVATAEPLLTLPTIRRPVHAEIVHLAEAEPVAAVA